MSATASNRTPVASPVPATPPVSAATRPSGHEVAVEQALSAARRHLLDRQEEDGHWRGLLQTNVTMDAEDLFLRHVLDIHDPDLAARTGRWLRAQQLADGGWATFAGGPEDLSTTLEAYVALRLVGDRPEEPHMRDAAMRVRGLGGPAHSRVFTRMWLALLGLWDWDDLPAMPPEIMLLPTGVPLNIYDFASWARGTVVPITVVSAHRPVVPVGFDLHGLHVSAPAPIRAGWHDWAERFTALDRVLHGYERMLRSRLAASPLGWPRQRALGAAEAWIVRRQEADGSWGGIQPPWVWSLLALWCRGYPLDHPLMRAGLEGLEGFAVEEEGMRWLEACQSPVWDTALATVALADAGVAPDHSAMTTAADWLADHEVRVPGDWSVRRPDLPAGGWAFEYANVNYPDLDDTAEVVMALRRTGRSRTATVEDAVARATTWTLGMQCRDGGWGAFDVDNDARLCTLLPFCDFGEVVDPPSADVTAHVVEMLVEEDLDDHRALARAVDWLWDEQEPDGSWFGRWGCNHLYGTGAVVPALVRAGTDPQDPRIRRAVAWLEAHQNADGGWGEDLRSYRDPSWVGRGASTPSQTAWALLALLAAGERDSPAVTRGVAHLVETQRPDGGWDEATFTGTGFPGDFSINYHLYRVVFPVMALGRYVGASA